MFIEVLECVLRETHSLLIRMLLLKELLSRWVVTIGQDNLSRLPLNVYHLAVSRYSPTVLRLGAEIGLRPHSVGRNVLIEAL